MKKTIEKKKSLFWQIFSQKVLFYMLCTMLFIVPNYVFGQEQITVTGVVTETSGEVLPEVNVIIKGITQGVVSDVDGRYNLSVNSNGVLVFSFIGYQSQEITIEGKI